MSLKPTGLRASAKADHDDLNEKQPRSDNLWTVDLSDSDSESVSESASRPKVGLRGSRSRSYSLAQKLAARTIPRPSGCWEVQGHANRSGHVKLATGSPANPPYIRVGAHVVAWEVANGRAVPPGKVVMHHCDNPRCVNPAHLGIGTQRDNVLDSIHKGRYNCFGRQKLDAAKVQRIRALAASGALQKDIARQFGIARNTVSGIVCGKTWAHLPFETLGVRGPSLEALNAVAETSDHPDQIQ